MRMKICVTKSKQKTHLKAKSSQFVKTRLKQQKMKQNPNAVRHAQEVEKEDWDVKWMAEDFTM